MTNKVYLISQRVRILDDSGLEEYRESVKSYNSEKARATLGEGNERVSSKGGLVAVSSPFIILQFAHLDSSAQGILPNKDTPATRQEIEQAISRDPSFLRGNEVDFGLALVTEEDSYNPNDLLARTLAEQLQERGIELGTGKLIPFSTLAKPVEHPGSDYGLVFNLNDSASRENILDLEEFNWDIRSRKRGLARAYLIDRYWGCDVRNLDLPYSNGRIVGVGWEDAPKNLTLGSTNEKWRQAFEKAKIPGNYEFVKQHLQDD